MRFEQFIENQYRNFGEEINPEYNILYSNFKHQKLENILSTVHAIMNQSFEAMNERLPTREATDVFFRADPSRILIKAIRDAQKLQSNLANSSYSFSIDTYYQSLITKCDDFLKNSGGSVIPANMEKIDIYHTSPIFIPSNCMKIAVNKHDCYNLKLIGKGSYAHVYKYKDNSYNKTFVLKKANKGLKLKEIERFELEFTTMRKLSSPYIVEVYKYDSDKKEYIMEFMDCTLDDYIIKNNANLTEKERKNICFQIFKAFSYIHSKKKFHRDISPNNVLIKKYDDIIVVKISDFGLVKVPDSTVTSVNTKFKGSMNDPNLELEGFNKYNILHETYALTRLTYFILTGKKI